VSDEGVWPGVRLLLEVSRRGADGDGVRAEGAVVKRDVVGGNVL